MDRCRRASQRSSRLARPAERARSRGSVRDGSCRRRDRNKTLWCGWTIAADDVRVFFAGDTALQPEFESIARAAGPFDLVMLPIGAYDPRWFMRSVHADSADAVATYRALTHGAERLPPCLSLHWGTFRLTDEPVNEPPTPFAEEWKRAGLPPDLNWTFVHGETRRLGG